ncbi:hypothetical protein BV898_10519 [Hypsibius exemplaris]|uniref:Uncharacterized protein n=1 Tax=Hypsibius exemplaris TaxID=2072580 RepID=A0A1W0WJ92_HYPEX|nr:hypothetical protein BV898_10519 [Hypsibius exemplaris]
MDPEKLRSPSMANCLHLSVFIVCLALLESATQTSASSPPAQGPLPLGPTTTTPGSTTGHAPAAGAATTPKIQAVTMIISPHVSLNCSEYLWQTFVQALPGGNSSGKPPAAGDGHGEPAKGEAPKGQAPKGEAPKDEHKEAPKDEHKEAPKDEHKEAAVAPPVHSEHGGAGVMTTKPGGGAGATTAKPGGSAAGMTTAKAGAAGMTTAAKPGGAMTTTMKPGMAGKWTAPVFSFNGTNCTIATDAKWTLDPKVLEGTTKTYNVTVDDLRSYLTDALVSFGKGFTATYNVSSKSLTEVTSMTTQWFAKNGAKGGSATKNASTTSAIEGAQSKAFGEATRADGPTGKEKVVSTVHGAVQDNKAASTANNESKSFSLLPAETHPLSTSSAGAAEAKDGKGGPTTKPSVPSTTAHAG